MAQPLLFSFLLAFPFSSVLFISVCIFVLYFELRCACGFGFKFHIKRKSFNVSRRT